MHGATIKIILSHLNPLIYVKYNLQVFRMCVCGWTTRVFMNVMHCVCVRACARVKYYNAMAINIYTVLHIGLKHCRHSSLESPKYHVD
jgi:hypothetical protein